MKANFFQDILKPLEASLMLKNSKIKFKKHNPIYERVFFELRHDEGKASIIACNGAIGTIFNLNCTEGIMLYCFLTKHRKGEELNFLSLSREQVKAIIGFLKKEDEQPAQDIFNEAIKHNQSDFDYKRFLVKDNLKKSNSLEFKQIYLLIAVKIFSKMKIELSKIELKELKFKIEGKSDLGSEISFFGLGLFYHKNITF